MPKIIYDAVSGGALFQCPGCKHVHHILTAVTGPTAKRWGWNGSFERPTFQPSIMATSDRWFPPVTEENLHRWQVAPWHQERRQYVCHSYITDGQIQFLDDCTHALAGQTVDLPEAKFYEHPV